MLLQTQHCSVLEEVLGTDEAFEPDVIIALGGGSAMDAAKIMWLMYEHPEANFEDMAMDFMDIRKRVYTFPKMGKKAILYSYSNIFRYRF